MEFSRVLFRSPAHRGRHGMSSASAQFGSQSPATLSLPDAIEGDGLLVGWSLETRRHSRPVGFSFGDQVDAAGRAALPILLAGEGHLITIAPTGAGKGVGCVVPSLLRHRGPADRKSRRLNSSHY